MAANTLTLALEGDVPLDQYALALQRLAELVATLSEEVAQGTAIDWWIDDLQFGSAVATVRGEATDVEPVERVVAAYATVGRALQQHEPIPYSLKVAERAKAITSILDGKVTSVRFETDRDDAVIETPSSPMSAPPHPSLVALGAVDGRVETLTSRRSLRFTLYDALNDRAVSCYLQDGQQELMRDAWGKRCLVEGLVTRDGENGRPLAIRQVRRIDVLPEPEPEGYLKARGILQWRPPAPLPEELVRRLRDA